MNLLSVLDAAERIIYYIVALALIIPVRMLFVSAAVSMLRVLEVEVLQTVLVILDRALLVFIFVELLDTIRITVRERGSIVAEPFCWWG
jgi:Phosphate-starvation-inducible E family